MEIVDQCRGEIRRFGVEFGATRQQVRGLIIDW